MQAFPQAPFEVVVVGGGLAGLTASLLLARGGKRVCLVERAPQLGGRAITQRQDGYALNLGPHALYRGGHAMRILRKLGITPREDWPPPGATPDAEKSSSACPAVPARYWRPASSPE